MRASENSWPYRDSNSVVQPVSIATLPTLPRLMFQADTILYLKTAGSLSFFLYLFPDSYLNHSQLSLSGMYLYIYVTDYSLRGRQARVLFDGLKIWKEVAMGNDSRRKLLSRKVLHVQADVCFAGLLTSVAMVSAYSNGRHAICRSYIRYYESWEYLYGRSLSKCRSRKSLRLLLSHEYFNLY
jgi:hypothetical protein